MNVLCSYLSFVKLLTPELGELLNNQITQNFLHLLWLEARAEL